MTSGDIEGVYEIEQHTLSSWSRGQLEIEQAHPLGWHYIAKDPLESQILGFIFGRTVIDEAEILKLAVHENFRRQGIAGELIGSSMAQLNASGIKKCFLELRSKNIPAKNLYEKKGFITTGIRKNYYNHPIDDAIMMAIHLS